MGYIQDLEKELREKLGQMDQEELIKFFKEKVLESYRNGISQAKKGKGRAVFYQRQGRKAGETSFSLIKLSLP